MINREHDVSWRTRWFDEWRQDVAYAFRGFRRAPGFAITAVLTLALGVGANTAMFDVVSSILLRPLPYRDPGRLVAVFETNRNGEPGDLSAPDLEDWRRQSSRLTHLETYFPGTAALNGMGESERIRTAEVTPGFLDVFGVAPILGAPFQEGEPGVVISEGLWRRRFGGQRDIVGKTIVLDRRPRSVVGVMPSRFDFPHRTDVWVSLDLSGDFADAKRGDRYFRVVGQLSPGTSRTTAQAELGAIAARLAAEYPKTNASVGARLQDLQETLTGDIRPTLLLLMSMVGLVLLIACSNVASLLLVRGVSRRREIAVRAALGASTGRLMRQLLTESVLIAIGGALVGVITARFVANAIRAADPIVQLPLNPDAANGWVFAFVALLVPATVCLFGIIPALRAARVDLRDPLSDSSRGSTSGRLRGGLITMETALATVLLVGAVLASRSLWRLQGERLGFDPTDVTVVSAKPPGGMMGAPRLQFQLDVLERLRSVPGVTSAAVTNLVPLGGGAKDEVHFAFEIQGHQHTGDNSSRKQVDWRVTSDGYFRTLGLPVTSGREFLPSERDSTPVVIINEAAARTYWPGQNPVGSWIAVPELSGETVAAHRKGDELWFTVVGVVGDIREEGLGVPARPAVYLPLSSRLSDIVPEFVVRTRVPVGAIKPSLIRAVRAVSQDAPVTIQRMSDLVGASIATPRLRALLIGIFALLALILAAVGIYGVAAQVMAERTREIGIRLALGARPMAVVRTVVVRAAGYAFLGLLLGIGAAAFGARIVAAFLYGIAPTDVLTFGLVTVVLGATVLLSSFLPARHAAWVDPAITLRSE